MRVVAPDPRTPEGRKEWGEKFHGHVLGGAQSLILRTLILTAVTWMPRVPVRNRRFAILPVWHGSVGAVACMMNPWWMPTSMGVYAGINAAADPDRQEGARKGTYSIAGGIGPTKTYHFWRDIEDQDADVRRSATTQALLLGEISVCEPVLCMLGLEDPKLARFVEALKRGCSVRDYLRSPIEASRSEILHFLHMEPDFCPFCGLRKPRCCPERARW